MNGSPQQSARIVHLAMVGGVALALGAFAAMRGMGAAPKLEPAVGRVVARSAVVLVIVAIFGSAALGRRLERGLGTEAGSGRRGLPSLLPRWALVEGAALLAGVAWLLSGAGWALSAAVAALAALALSGPPRGIE